MRYAMPRVGTFPVFKIKFSTSGHREHYSQLQHRLQKQHLSFLVFLKSFSSSRNQRASNDKNVFSSIFTFNIKTFKVKFLLHVREWKYLGRNPIFGKILEYGSGQELFSTTNIQTWTHILQNVVQIPALAIELTFTNESILSFRPNAFRKNMKPFCLPDPSMAF